MCGRGTSNNALSIGPATKCLPIDKYIYWLRNCAGNQEINQLGNLVRLCCIPSPVAYTLVDRPVVVRASAS
jgi:hypothetical protein